MTDVQAAGRFLRVFTISASLYGAKNWILFGSLSVSMHSTNLKSGSEAGVARYLRMIVRAVLFDKKAQEYCLVQHSRSATTLPLPDLPLSFFAIGCMLSEVKAGRLVP